MGDTFQDSEGMCEAMSTPEPCVLCFSYTYIPFDLKEAANEFSLAFLNGQHHDSCALGTLLSKIKVT